MWSGFLCYKEPQSSLTALGPLDSGSITGDCNPLNWHGRKHVNVNRWHVAGHLMMGLIVLSLGSWLRTLKLTETLCSIGFGKDFTPVVVSKLIGRIICIMSANTYDLLPLYPNSYRNRIWNRRTKAMSCGSMILELGFSR